MENEYGWFMRVYGMSFVSSEILKPEPRKHKKIKAQNSEVGTTYTSELDTKEIMVQSRLGSPTNLQKA